MAKPKPGSGIGVIHVKVTEAGLAKLHKVARAEGFRTLAAFVRNVLSQKTGVYLGESWESGFRGNHRLLKGAK